MFRHNCHHQGAYAYIVKSCSDEKVLQCLFKLNVLILILIYLLTEIRLTTAGSSTVYTYTQNNAQNNTLKENTQNGTYITIRINKHNNKNT
jgi:hypothetical protein